MSGVKGRSGRKSTTEEKKRLVIIDKAWDVIAEQLNDPNLNREKKLAIAKDIVVKSMPQKLEGEGLDTHIYNIIQDVQQDFQKSRMSSVVLDSRNGDDE